MKRIYREKPLSAITYKLPRITLSLFTTPKVTTLDTHRNIYCSKFKFKDMRDSKYSKEEK